MTAPGAFWNASRQSSSVGVMFGAFMDAACCGSSCTGPSCAACAASSGGSGCAGWAFARVVLGVRFAGVLFVGSVAMSLVSYQPLFEVNDPAAVGFPVLALGIVAQDYL